MYSYNDFERLFLRYKLEGLPAGVSLEKFCLSNKVPYNLFEKWYKDTRKKIIPVQFLGAPSPEAGMKEIASSIPEQKPVSRSISISKFVLSEILCASRSLSSPLKKRI